MAAPRKPRTPYMNIYMDPEMQILIKQEAQKRGIGASELVRQAVSLFLTGTTEWHSLLTSPEKHLESTQSGENPPESWEEFYRQSTYLFLATSKLVETWRQRLINKAKAEAEGLTLEEWIRKHLHE